LPTTATQSSSGTQFAIIGVEHILYNPKNNRWFSGYVDLSHMKSGDRVELRVYVLVKSVAGDYYVEHYVNIYTDVQTYPLIYIPICLSISGWKLTLKQTEGTGRTFDWNVYES
jgi:hypothetical protein